MNRTKLSINAKKRNFILSSAKTLLAIGISLLIAFLIIFIVSDKPGEAISIFLTGPVSSLRRIGSIITTAIPIIFTGLAVCIMFQANMMNMGAEGSFFLGAFAAAAITTKINFSGILAIIVPMLVSVLVGAFLCAIPAFMKAWLDASEMVSSLMLNYASLYFGLYLLNSNLRDQSFGALATHKIPQNARLSNLVARTSIHSGLILAIVFVFMCYMFLYKTKTGFKIRAYGQNSKFAQYAGISASSMIMISQLLGGALAGLGGYVEIMGMYDRFQWTSLPGYGWDGIMLAILARNKPQYIPLAAVFLAYLKVGASSMAISTDVPSEIITVMQAIMIMLVTAQALLRNWRQTMILKGAENT